MFPEKSKNKNSSIKNSIEYPKKLKDHNILNINLKTNKKKEIKPEEDEDNHQESTFLTMVPPAEKRSGSQK